MNHFTSDTVTVRRACDGAYMASERGDLIVCRACLHTALSATRRLAAAGKLEADLRAEVNETFAALAAKGWL